MFHNTSSRVGSSALASMIAAVHQSNPILQAAVRTHRTSTIFPTTLSIPEAEQAGLYPGYYLRCADSNNYWIGRDKREASANLDQATSRHLRREFNFDYDIEYSFGQVVGGGSPWSNFSALDEMV